MVAKQQIELGNRSRSFYKVSHVQIKENITDVVNRFQFVEVNNPAVLPKLSPEFDGYNDRCLIELRRASGDELNLHYFISAFVLKVNHHLNIIALPSVS